MYSFFLKISETCSTLTTKSYSTSFSFGIKLLNIELQQPIYNIYGFVRFADEIVDTFHNHDKRKLLDQFKKDCFKSINDGISLNPILNSFQSTVNKYNIEHELIEKFFNSMYMDLEKQNYNEKKYKNYIIGSAEVIGLICLKIFLKGNNKKYSNLKPYACALGSAFQKVNFLRDLDSDYNILGRTYFPNIDIASFSVKEKNIIETDIYNDFKQALPGIKQLPKSSRQGVYLAYLYYLELLKKIQKTNPKEIMERRVRINNFYKFTLMIKSIIKNKLDLI